MKLKIYKESLNYLERFISNINFKRIEDNVSYDPLDRMRTLLGLLGNPQKKFKSILITGTAGKGSTAYLISHILKTAGYKVGLTISPHLQKVNERLQINGKEISDSKFVSLVSLLVGKIEQMSKMKVGAPSYFEILIAMAFLYFAQEKVDLAVVEVGIEGKYDATNVLLPLILVLSNISLDHTQILGETIEEIAKEAVGAIKNHLVVVSGVSQKSILEIVKRRCRETNSKFLLLGKDFNYRVKKTSLGGSTFDLTTSSDRVQQLNDLQLSLMGRYQVENASLAVETVLQLKNFGFKVSEKDIRLALKTAFFPGRFELVERRITQKSTQKDAEISVVQRTIQQRSSANIILDGAHNPAKMQAFISSLKKLFPSERKIFVIAFKKDKNIKEMLKSILPVADVIIATEFSMATDVSKNASADAESIKHQVSYLRQGYGGQVSMMYKGKVIVEKDSEKALDKALKVNKELKNSLVVVTGSLYLVGEIRNKIALF